VGALPRLDGHIEVAGRIGDLTKHRQIGRRQAAVRVRLHEQVECLLPVALRCSVTGAFDQARPRAIIHRTPPNP
jgi:hypothetical protein